MKKLIVFLFIFIIGLHNKTQGCGASVASAAGPFTTKKTLKNCNVPYTDPQCAVANSKDTLRKLCPSYNAFNVYYQCGD
jgi:hypothetical protein